MSVANLKIRLTGQTGSLVRLSADPTSSKGTRRSKFSAGKALTTARAAKPERAAKSEKCIVIKLRIGKLGAIGSGAWWFEAVTGHLYLSAKWSMDNID
jgi:hypothetical protein